MAACREFRRWGLSHKDEFTLLFGVPLPGLDDGRFDVAEECALEFAGTFYALFLELWNATHFPVPGPAEIDEVLRAQLGRFRAARWAPTRRTARSWCSCAAGCCSTARCRWRSSVTWGSRSTTRPRCSSSRSADLARLVGLEYPLPAA